MPRVSIVVPCYNAASYIQRSFQLLLDHCESNTAELRGYEIIAVDDGSSDNTPDVIAQFFPAIHLVRLPVNQGKGAAVRAGILAAKGEFRFFIDSDIPYDLSALIKMLSYLDEKEFHVVIGTRNTHQLEPYLRRTPLRRFASALFTLLISRIVVTGVRDTQCGFKGFRADIADYLFRESRVNRFAFDVEVLYLAYKNDLDIKRIPVNLLREDVSTVRVFRDGLQMLASILRIPFRYYTGRYRMMTPPDRT